jgi:hypothetical protein
MAKTTFSSGVIVTSAWLNGAQQIFFDGQNLDWHYNPLGLDSLVTGGPNGLDSRYVTLATSQPTLTPVTVSYIDPRDPTQTITYQSFLLVSGSPISGDKVFTGFVSFGYDPYVIGNPRNTLANAPVSYTTNDKYNFANGVLNPSISQKFSALQPADLVTKQIYQEGIENALEFLTIDNGYFYYAADPAQPNIQTCNNYTLQSSPADPLTNDIICGT